MVDLDDLNDETTQDLLCSGKSAPERENRSRPKHPWFKIWFKPRETMREIISYDPGYLVIPIAIISGVVLSIGPAFILIFGYQNTFLIGILCVLIMGPILGLIAVYLGGAIFYWIGKLPGGRGRDEEVRAAVAWSYIPFVFISILGLPQYFFGLTSFYTNSQMNDSLVYLVQLIVLFGVTCILSVLSIAGSIWGYVIQVKCIAEAHRFSAWRGLATLVIPAAVLLAAGLIFLYLSW